MKRWIALSAAAAVVAVVLVIAGVGGSGPDTAPRSTIADAAAATSATTGYRVALNATVDTPEQDTPTKMTGRGVVDPRGRRGRQTLTFGGIEMEQVYAGFVFYMRSPVFAAALPKGKSWVRMDVQRLGRRLGLDFGQMASGDPSQSLDQLRAVSGDVERLGRDRVRGVAATHYRATVDLRRYPNLVPPARRAAVRAGVKRIAELTGLERFPQEVWVGSDGRIRRLALEYSVRPPGVDGKVTTKLTMELYGFGVPVEVDVPPEDEVEDFTEIASGALANQ